MHYTILYRGPLSSCNYGCTYCPFAKHRESRSQLEEDRAALERFVDWVEQQGVRGHEISILFTPWGEALTRAWYQQALVRLTHQSHVRKAAIQTNLSARLDWVEQCDRAKLGLWCSLHPTETTRERFLSQCRTLDRFGVRYSVGIVGVKEQLADAYAIRHALQPNVYVWINAIKRQDDYYDAAERDAFAAIDPLFEINNTRHPSRGRACATGESVFSVDGAGTMRRCHFIATPIGNIYEDNWQAALRPSPCTNETCGCHIGYVHMPALNLGEVFGDGLLERIPRTSTWSADAAPPMMPIEPSRSSRSLVRLSLRQAPSSA